MSGEPARELASELVPTTGAAQDPALRRCLFVHNHTDRTAAILVDGRHVGSIGPFGSAAFFAGRSAGPVSELRAVCDAGEWSASIRGPAWEYRWHLRRAVDKQG